MIRLDKRSGSFVKCPSQALRALTQKKEPPDQNATGRLALRWSVEVKVCGPSRVMEPPRQGARLGTKGAADAGRDGRRKRRSASVP